MTLANLLSHAKGGTGLIATVSPYLKEIQSCLSGSGVCPAKMFSLESGDTWKKMLAEADERLTYADPEGMIKSATLENLTDGSILEYDAVLSTSQKDRDGDIVRTDGMQLEGGMPLLWQHVWSQPIGKMLSVVDQNSERVVCKYAIADTDLGRDAATLVRMGALRKSHGFFPIPGKFEPLEVRKNADGTTVVSGYDIKACSVYESSLVSIPANAGAKVLQVYEKQAEAIFHAVEQKALKTDAMNNWAKGLYENRQRFFAGIDFDAKLEKAMSKVFQEAKQQSGESPQDGAKDMQSDSRPKCNSCMDGYCDESGSCDHCGNVKPHSGKTASDEGVVKSFAASGVEKMLGMPDSLPGSFEHVQRSLRKKAEDFLESKDVDVSDYEYVELIATFTDSAILCKRNYRKDSQDCYRVAYALEDGKAMFTGDPEKVEIEANVVAKMLDDSGARVKEMGLADHARVAVGKAFAQSDDTEDAVQTLKTAIRLLEQSDNEPQDDPLAVLFGS